MPSPKVAALTKADITAAARSFRWTRSLPKWTVMVEGRELPARPLILGAAAVPPNDPTNSHQAVSILESHGFEVRYQGQPTNERESQKMTRKEVGEIIRRLQGRFTAEDHAAMLASRERDHRIEKDRWPR
jgi:hypothetical protein